MLTKRSLSNSSLKFSPQLYNYVHDTQNCLLHKHLLSLKPLKSNRSSQIIVFISAPNCCTVDAVPWTTLPHRKAKAN